MAKSDRTYRVGQLTIETEALGELRIEIDGVAKSILDCFDRIGMSTDYVDDIDVRVLNVHVRNLVEKMEKLKKAKERIEALKQETGTR
jgi:hypothetical protein